MFSGRRGIDDDGRKVARLDLYIFEKQEPIMLRVPPTLPLSNAGKVSCSPTILYFHLVVQHLLVIL